MLLLFFFFLKILKDKQKLANISYRNNTFDFFKIDANLKETPENFPKTYDVFIYFFFFFKS